MKVLHVNTSDFGGAATAIIRIHLALLEKGVDSKILLLKKTKDIPETYAFYNPHYKKRRLNFLQRVVNKVLSVLKPAKNRRDLIRGKLLKVEAFSFPTSNYDITEHPLYKDADIIQLNWVSGFLDEPSFFRKNRKPVIWRMADLYACGSGNHYESGFPFNDFKEELAANFTLRKKVLANKKITLVAISHWVKAKAEQSELLKNFESYVIHNGINSNTFKVVDRGVARELFSLPAHGKVILFGADRVNNTRKGLTLLLNALDLLVLPKDTTVCIFGSVKEALRDNIINMGRIEDDRLLSMLYSAADLFVMSSVEEAFGQVTIEALSCGTPVVSFPTGGSVDIIIPGVTGVLATDFTSVALAEAISTALDTSFDRGSIRKDTISRFNISDKADQYIGLYKKQLNLE